MSWELRGELVDDLVLARFFRWPQFFQPGLRLGVGLCCTILLDVRLVFVFPAAQ